MKLLQITVRRLAGIERGFEIPSIAPGLCVIVGPNASGKSSLCRAVHATLWPDDCEFAGTDVVTLWTDEGGEVLRAALTGGAHWQREGVDCEPPAVPDASLAHCYRLGMRDLLDVGGATGAALAERIRVEMSGGYDFRAARETLARLSSDGRSEDRELAEAERASRKIEGEQRVLGRDADRLGQLEEELEEIASARRELQELGAAARIASDRPALEALERSLADFPESMDRLSGEELGRLEQIEGDLARAREEREQYQRDLEAAVAEREACGFIERPVAASELEEMLQRVRNLFATESKREVARSALDVAAASEDVAARALGVGSGRVPDHITGADLDGLDAWVGEAFTLRHERRRIEALRDGASAMSDGAGPLDAERIRKGLGWLRDWIAAADPRETSEFGRRLALGAGALAGVVLGILSHALFLLLTAAALGMFVQAWLGDRRAAARRAHARNEFEALSLDAPDRWDRRGVAHCMNRLEQQLAERAREEILERERETAVRQLTALAPREAALAAQRQAFLERIGVDPGVTDLHLADLLGRIRDWRSAHRNRVAAEAELAEIDREHADALDVLCAFLGRNAVGPVEDATGTQAALDELRTRAGRWRSAEDRRHACEREVARRQWEVDEFATRRDALLRNVGLDPGDLEAARRELASRIERLEEWHEATRRRLELERSREEARRALGEAHALLSLDAEDLERRRRAAQSRVDEHDRVAGEIGRIEDRVREARRGEALERARARVNAARGALAASREAFLDAEACRFFLDEVEADYERESRPAVLRRAMEFFDAFTRHRFALRPDLGDGSGTFRAVDTASHQGLGLEQLSDGTRMQLWLATRLAFAEHAESGRRVPLFLDEALTASDPERFRAVAACVFEMVRAGRQVFYLTADPGDVATWQQIAAERGEPDPAVIDLAAVRGLAAATAPRGTATRLEAVPAPDGCGAHEYARRLAVPPLDPFAPLDAAHLFHPLCGDLELLHELLDAARVERIGHYRALVESGAAKLLLSEDQRRWIELQIDIVDAFLGCWKIGRGKPVDRSVLEASQAVTKTFLDRLSELCAELGGDAARLLEAIEARADERVKRFHKASVSDLRAYLERGGHLKHDAPLSPDEICSRVVSAVAAHIRDGRIAGGDAAKRVQELASQLADSPS